MCIYIYLLKCNKIFWGKTVGWLSAECSTGNINFACTFFLARCLDISKLDQHLHQHNLCETFTICISNKAIIMLSLFFSYNILAHYERRGFLFLRLNLLNFNLLFVFIIN